MTILVAEGKMDSVGRNLINGLLEVSGGGGGGGAVTIFMNREIHPIFWG